MLTQEPSPPLQLPALSFEGQSVTYPAHDNSIGQTVAVPVMLDPGPYFVGDTIRVTGRVDDRMYGRDLSGELVVLFNQVITHGDTLLWVLRPAAGLDVIMACPSNVEAWSPECGYVEITVLARP